MKGWHIILLCLGVVLLGVGGALLFTQQASEQTPATPVDNPYLSSQEAISIAQREAVANYAWAYTAKMASYYASRSAGWNAEYTGDGKWTVELSLLNDDKSLTIYRWTVFERNLTATYIGASRQPSKTEVLSSQQTPEQVVSIVVGQAVRKLSSYGSLRPTGNLTAVYEVGQWTAVYEGKGKWRVQGTVAFTVDGQYILYASTTWIYDYETATLTDLKMNPNWSQ